MRKSEGRSGMAVVVAGLCLGLLGPALVRAAEPAKAAAPTKRFYQPAGPEMLERVRQLLKEVPLIDGHNDLPWQFRERAKNQMGKLDLRADGQLLNPPLMTDVRRLKLGGLGGQFWSVYVPADLVGATAVKAVLEQIDDVYRLTESYPDVFEIARTADDVVRIHKAGKVASLIGMEGGHSIDNSLGVLRQLYRAGARYMTLTHSKNDDWGDSATDDPKHGGLTPFGREVVREMNRLGMLVDLSHVAPRTMKVAIETSAAPVIFSHSSARALTDHPRDVPDDVLKLVAKNDGVVMVTFVPSFVSEEVRAWSADRDAAQARVKSLYAGDPERQKSELEAWETAHPAPHAQLPQVADHIDHIRQVAGIDHIGLGSDFDGVTSTPDFLSSVSDYPFLLAELLRRGYSDEDVKKIAGLNVLRALRQAETVAARLQKERPASDALIEELDKDAAKGKAMP
jgi:membrane dipeptidase